MVFDSSVDGIEHRILRNSNFKLEFLRIVP